MNSFQLISGGRISIKHLFLTSTFAILFGFGPGLDVIKSQHSSKPDALCAIRRNCFISKFRIGKTCQLKNPEIEAAKSKSESLLWAIVSTGIIGIIIYKEGESIFNWTKFNPNIISGLFVLLLSLGCINWWLQYFDNRPVFKLNNDGIWVRNVFLLFSKTIQIPWAQVNYFYLLEETRKSTTVSLMIGQKEIEIENKIELSSLNKSIADILEVLKKYSALYNFQELEKVRKL